MSSVITRYCVLDKSKDIFINLDYCLTPYKATTSVSKTHGNFISPDFTKINNIFQLHYKDLIKNLGHIGRMGFCWICDKTCLNITTVIGYEKLRSLIIEGPVSRHSNEVISFDTIENYLIGSSICVECCVKCLLTAYPVSALREMIGKRIPYIVGKVVEREIILHDESFSLYHDSFVNHL
ncbi:20K [red clover associated varicosavirus]|uniref:20K n=1 Tax=red clover associated varicosavirus TaxID=2848052 RepID=A0A2R2Z7P1_9RHAB|nr:20K [Red clover varicosavirus]AUD57856.1 20K [red clover associated varicosavirus]